MSWHLFSIARKQGPTTANSRARIRDQDARGWMSKLALLLFILFIVFVLALVTPVITLVLTLLILG
jgi:hypothetical protein